jgi:hypothetical protein
VAALPDGHPSELSTERCLEKRMVDGVSAEGLLGVAGMVGGVIEVHGVRANLFSVTAGPKGVQQRPAFEDSRRRMENLASVLGGGSWQVVAHGWVTARERRWRTVTEAGAAWGGAH